MLLNNLDPEVAEPPENLVVYGGRGKATKSWTDVWRIVDVLDHLEDGQTLLVQSGRAAGVFRTLPEAPRAISLTAISSYAGRQEKS